MSTVAESNRSHEPDLVGSCSLALSYLAPT